jgi:HEAT repeat protein
MSTHPRLSDKLKTGILLPMNRTERLLEKARGYLADMEGFLADPAVAVSVLLDALPHADTGLSMKMLPLLGYAGKDRVLWPLYHLMREASTDEQVRHLAAVQLGLAASLSRDPSALKAELIEKLDHPNPSVRSCCALALGWEGNGLAGESLLGHLSDPDRHVQESVIAALTSMGDRRVLALLIARLETGTVEEQRIVLLNLWRLAEQVPQVESVYLGCMETLMPELRVDALSGLAMLPFSTTILMGYLRFLRDEAPRIRRQVLANLLAAAPVDDERLKETVYGLLADEDAQIRQAAIRLLARR